MKWKRPGISKMQKRGWLFGMEIRFCIMCIKREQVSCKEYSWRDNGMLKIKRQRENADWVWWK